MSKQILQFAEDAPRTQPWVRVGTGFSTRANNGFNLVIGNKIPKEQGSRELVETVKSLTLEPGDELYLGEATGRDGKLITTKNGATVYRLSLKPARGPQEEKKSDK